ncbi:site-specific integrase [Streptosporangium sp. NBC_01469]|uniref:site-specific integrase n=1 Tax=Streptosporangium sp. NBC_01469 TaxID=2903898 RepID=UPI002E29A9A3|nr:site-specific integrase [Streptosporangium sp. NBC_01469]
MRHLLLWLKGFPGETWQQRWCATPAHSLGRRWEEESHSWLASRGTAAQIRFLTAGLLWLVCADVLRPDLEWLSTIIRSRYWQIAMATYRDPSGFDRLNAAADRQEIDDKRRRTALIQIATIMAAKGGKVADITVGDCLELRDAESRTRAGSGRGYFYDLLQHLEIFPADAPPTFRMLGAQAGQVSPKQLVDRYALECGPVRDLIVGYLTERQPVMDYNSLQQLSRALALNFWKSIETHHPGARSLRLPPDVITDWKSRLQFKTVRRRQSDGSIREVTSPRSSYIDMLTYVRGFYLDIAQWATEDPARWGPWAAPCPITAAEISTGKRDARRKARMDQRTRERLPAVTALAQIAHQQRVDAQARLDALRNAAPGQTFTVLNETFVKALGNTGQATGSNCAYDATGRLRQLAMAENRAFWTWAAVEILRHTGIRIEEMLEIGHQSITQYVTPGTGELVPLLHIAPSKTDQERLLVVDLELADVLAMIVSRVRDDTGTVPLVSIYDLHEKIWTPPMPILFQWRTGGENRPITPRIIRSGLEELLVASFTDATGQPLRFQPHDFRRIFTTEAILNGMPPHIAQLILGHKSIDTTMGYHTVYPQEVINGHRAFIARRRTMRPSEEYRTPTDEEWEEFRGHFERRKMALGDCGRAYGTSCQHEHSCIKCPLLRVAPADRPRLEEIRGNLIVRTAEAKHQGWLGELEKLRIYLASAEGKLAQLDERARRATTINLGMPSFPEIAGQTATLPGQRP